MSPTIHDLARAARQPGHDIPGLIAHRWSPRRMTGETLTEAELLPLFEAARWAPSSFNNQPWRFHYALRDTPAFADFLGLLVDKNRAWCQAAGCLIVLAAKTTFDFNGQPMRTHGFDTGSAWMALALESARRNIVAHGMAGFDYEAAARVLGLGPDFAVQCMIALGRPADTMAEEEITPRRPLAEITLPAQIHTR